MVALITGQVIGCELLALFEDNISPLYPDKFIAVVNELDMSWTMTERIILQTIDDFKEINVVDSGFYLPINVFQNDINTNKILKGIELLKDIKPNLQVCFDVIQDKELHFSKLDTTLWAIP